jgi:hypothetical protein
MLPITLLATTGGSCLNGNLPPLIGLPITGSGLIGRGDLSSSEGDKSVLEFVPLLRLSLAYDKNLLFSDR